MLVQGAAKNKPFIFRV